MNFQDIVVALVVLGAAWYVGRLVLKSVRNPAEQGCPGCEAHKSGGKRAKTGT